MENIKIYLINLKDKEIEDILTNYKECIREEDIKKMKQYKIDKNKKQSIISSILKNKYIKGNIYYNEYGKPLSNSIYFNISHSNDYVIMALCNKYSIGIDIEYKKENVNEKIINYVCNDDEINSLNNKGDKAFYYLWTKKEAILKCKGIGLVNNLKDVLKENKYYVNSFSYDDYIYSIAIDDLGKREEFCFEMIKDIE